MTPVLEVRGLVKRYGSAMVLDGIGLTVAEHQVVTLIGSSGSGKSTLLRCVDLLEEIDDGQILLDGVDVSDPRADTAAAQRRMAIVFQAFNLFPHMTALQNVALAPRVVHGVPAAEADERALQLHALPRDCAHLPCADDPAGAPHGLARGPRSPPTARGRGRRPRPPPARAPPAERAPRSAAPSCAGTG